MIAAKLLQSAVLGVVLITASACSTSPNARSVGTVVSDATISTKVKAALAGDPDVKAIDVQVETYKGTVQLSGFVSSRENVTRAVDLARRVDGVRSVKNDLIVK